MKKYMIRKLIAALAVMAMAVLVTSFVFQPTEPTQWKAVTIANGDTLWAIARQEYGDSADIRRKIAEIEKMNGIDADMLHAGDVILIPVRTRPKAQAFGEQVPCATLLSKFPIWETAAIPERPKSESDWQTLTVERPRAQEKRCAIGCGLLREAEQMAEDSDDNTLYICFESGKQDDGTKSA